jgi:hypothetical protein
MELVGTYGKEEKEMVSEVDLVVMEVEKEDKVLVGTMVLVERMVMVLVETGVLVVKKVSEKEMGKEENHLPLTLEEVVNPDITPLRRILTLMVINMNRN